METTTAKHGPALAAAASDYLDRLIADEKREEGMVWEDLDYTRSCLVSVIETYRMDGVSGEELRAMLEKGTRLPTRVIRGLLYDYPDNDEE